MDSHRTHLTGITLAGLPALPVLAGMLLLRTVLLFAANGIAYGIVRATNPAATYNQALGWANVSIIAVDLITIGLTARALAKSGASLRTLLRPKGPSEIGWSLLIFIIVFVGFIVASFLGNLVAYFGPPPIGSAGHPPLWVGLLAISIMPLTIAIAEEVLYRGYLQGVFASRWPSKCGRVAGIVVVSVFFAIQHFALTPVDAQAWLARFITTFLAGILFAVLAIWMKRLFPLIVAHWLLDLFGLGLPLLMAALAS